MQFSVGVQFSVSVQFSVGVQELSVTMFMACVNLSELQSRMLKKSYKEMTEWWSRAQSFNQNKKNTKVPVCVLIGVFCHGKHFFIFQYLTHVLCTNTSRYSENSYSFYAETHIKYIFDTKACIPPYVQKDK
jgi:hypothetical protein